MAHKIILGLIFAIFFAAASLTAAETQVVTGKVVSINAEARAIAIEQIDPATGQPKTIYLASVLNEDLVDANALDELQVGQTVSVRVGDLHHLSTTPPAGLTQTTRVKEVTKEGEGLLEDVEKSSLSIP